MKGGRTMKGINFLIAVNFVCYNQVEATCRFPICLIWKVSETQLTLVCKIDKIEHIVSMLNNKNAEIADCYPKGVSSECQPHAADVSVSRTANVITVLFNGLIDEHVNGIWTCKHGSSLTNASVEVTVLGGGPLDIHIVLSIVMPLFGLLGAIIFTSKCVKDKLSKFHSNYIQSKEDASGFIQRHREPVIITIVMILVFVTMLLISVMFPINQHKIRKNVLVGLFCGLFNFDLAVLIGLLVRRIIKLKR